jgi:hypothetical protein
MKLKKRLIILALLLFAGTSFAGEIETAKKELCFNLMNLSKLVMEQRQEDMPITVMLTVLEGIQENKMKQMTETVMISAYKMPIFKNEKNRQEVINKFMSTVYINCIEGINK